MCSGHVSANAKSVELHWILGTVQHLCGSQPRGLYDSLIFVCLVHVNGVYCCHVVVNVQSRHWHVQTAPPSILIMLYFLNVRSQKWCLGMNAVGLVTRCVCAIYGDETHMSSSVLVFPQVQLNSSLTITVSVATCGGCEHRRSFRHTGTELGVSTELQSYHTPLGRTAL